MKCAFGVILLGLCVGCARQQWPEPPVIDQATYQKDYQKWLDAQQETARDGTKEVGIWPLQEGETAFGSDASLPTSSTESMSAHRVVGPRPSTGARGSGASSASTSGVATCS